MVRSHNSSRGNAVKVGLVAFRVNNRAVRRRATCARADHKVRTTRSSKSSAPAYCNQARRGLPTDCPKHCISTHTTRGQFVWIRRQMALRSYTGLKPARSQVLLASQRLSQSLPSSRAPSRLRVMQISSRVISPGSASIVCDPAFPVCSGV